VRTPGLPITAAEVAAHAATLPEDRLTLTFLTPLRLVDGGRLVHAFAPRPFLQRLHERLDQLALAYGEAASIAPARGGAPGDGEAAAPGERRTLLTLADKVRVVADDTRWVDVVGYSSRQGRRLPIGGLVGAVTLAGPLGPLRESLVWGSLIHVGKNAVKGDGWYRVAAAA
jgi:hypothetical protein